MGTLRRNIFLVLGSLFATATLHKSGGAVAKKEAAHKVHMPRFRGSSKRNNKAPSKPRWAYQYRTGDGMAVFMNVSSGEFKNAPISNVGGVNGRPFSFAAKKYFGL